MTKTVQDVKFVIHTLIDKCSGNNEEPFSTEEIETLIFAFESHILFDRVAHKFVPSLKGLIGSPVVPPLEVGTNESHSNDIEIAEHSRDRMVKTILITAMKESIFSELSIRFGI